MSSYSTFINIIRVSYWFSTMTNTGDTLMFKCANEAVYRETVQKLITDQGVFNLMKQVYSSTRPYSYYCKDSQYVIYLEWK